jgi:hypothetical protein
MENRLRSFAAPPPWLQAASGAGRAGEDARGQSPPLLPLDFCCAITSSLRNPDRARVVLSTGGRISHGPSPLAPLLLGRGVY